MANHRKFSFESIGNTGFSTSNTTTEGGRLNNKDGSINIQKTGLPFWERISLYHTLLRLPRWTFLFVIFAFYTVLNTFFAFIYVLVGVENLRGINDGVSMMGKFEQAFFFSSQTLTTVGYGHISPVSLASNIVASLESFIGILAFALVTGLLYGRFTRPQAYLLFSKNILIAPYKGITALMARVVSYKNNHITDAEANVTLVIHINENGTKVRRFFNLPLEIKKINSLALSWTLVHPINEESPLYQMSHEELRESDIEVLYHIKGFDDHFSNTVQQRTSYLFSEMVYGAKFQPMFHRSDDGSTTILEMDKVNDHEPALLPEIVNSTVNM
jgi:inward rectifier potassium channel